jgi:hypothetical protein
MRQHLLAIAVILTVATGCDNVAWGGVDVELKSPPTSVRDSTGASEVEAAEAFPREFGPILLAGLRDGSRARLSVVGEIHGDSLAPFPNPDYPEDATRLAQLISVGSEWVLFSEGVRVGRLSADATSTSDEFCTPRASVEGVVELVPEAAGAERLLALAADVGDQRAYGTYAALQRDYDQGVATLNIAGEVIPRVGASWPAEGVLTARQDIRAMQLEGVSGQAVAATFLSRDQIAIGSPGQGAWAVFVLGVPTPNGYTEGYSWYRSVDTDGKGVPRYFSHLDWDGNGDAEILLDVFGANRRWFAGLSRRQGEWVRTFQDACGSGSSSGR